MSQVIIENPVINSPFYEPTRHFRFTDEGITNEIIDGRRVSSYFVPIAQPRKKGRQSTFTEWTQDRVEENKLVNQIRARVSLWRQGGYAGVTPTTGRLLAYWTNPEREKPLFFCQIEALETAIYLTEVARRYGDAWIENTLRAANDTSNPGLPRTAFKMATGSGKTVVMAMLIAWHTLNKLAYPQDARFSDTFLIVTPGITIRDRLRVLLPNDPQNYYRQRDVVPPQALEQLGQARMLITNFHAFGLREKVAAGKLTKAILAEGEMGVFTETPDQMVRRVCRELGNKKKISSESSGDLRRWLYLADADKAGAVSLHPRLRLPGGRKTGCARPSHRPESRLAWHVTRPKAVRPGPDGASRARRGCSRE